MSHAIIPGSFDPMTTGHRGLIKRAAGLFDRITVAIMINENKKYLFSMEERLEIARLTLADIANVNVISDSGMLCDLCRRTGAAAIVKGIRNTQDFVYEQEMAEYNRLHCPETETVYLPAYGDVRFISSTAVRNLLKKKCSADEFLHPAAAEYIRTLGAGKNE